MRGNDPWDKNHMASIVLSSIGSAIGNEILPGLGGRALGLLGQNYGAVFDKDLGLYGGSSSSKDGPRLENLKVQDSCYGEGIPVTFGQVRVAGNVIWASDLIETSHKTSTGGKGGVMGGGSSRTTYTYSIHCAIAIAAGEIGGIETIWADTKIIYQNGVWKSGVVASATIYTGADDQEPDPLMESYIGSGGVPAYRGLAYIVIEGLQLSNFSNRLPNLTFEVIPVGASANPEWIGNVISGVSSVPHSITSKGMPPLVLESGGSRVRRVLIGGIANVSTTTAFSVAEYDVTGEVPTQLSAAQSATFSVSEVNDCSWALAPDGRFVAMYLQTSNVAYLTQMVIYDAETKQFGSVYPLSLTYGDDCRQIAWIDAQHFVITDRSTGKRGVRVFARSGTGIVEIGVYDVFGAGTATTRLPLSYTQFIPMSGGLLYIVADNSAYFTALYACFICWQNNTLTVGTPYTLISGFVPGAGNVPATTLWKTGDGEWTLFFSTMSYMKLFSFVPSATSAGITRAVSTITNSTFTYSDCNYPQLYGDRLVVVQRNTSDNYYRMSDIVLNDSSFSLLTDGAVVENYDKAVESFGALRIDGSRLILLEPTGFSKKLRVTTMRRCNTGDTLDRVVSEILDRVGYGAGDYDVSSLAAVTLDGYVLDQPMTAAAAIAPLQVYEPFDLIESGAQLKAVKHANAALLAVPESECGATVKQPPENLPSRELTRRQELDLPVEININYLDASRDYETGSQRSRRQSTRGAKSIIKVVLPMVCTSAKAKQIAETRLFTAWAERERVKISLSRKYLALDPGDVIDIGDKLIRISKVEIDGGVLEVQGVVVPESGVASYAATDGCANGSTEGDQEAVKSQLYLMDLPLLRAEDDAAGVYVAISGNDGWPGASLWRAADGVNYSSIANFGVCAVAGIATTQLANANANYMDRTSAVYVQLLQGELSSCGDADLLNGANAALLGDEIIQFQTATLTAPGLYKLNNLFRGRRGTEGATSTHVVGERFALLNASAVQFVPALLTDRGRTYNFRALSNGQTLGEVWDVNFTYALKTLQPFAPAHVKSSRASGTGSDLTISWKRRARKNGDWIDNVDVPLDEAAELYDLEIMNGSTVMRTFSSISTTSQVYTAAQQTADWRSVPSAYTVNVYQLSALYGRGVVATKVI